MLQIETPSTDDFQFSIGIDRKGFIPEEELIRKGVKNAKDRMFVWSLASTGDLDEQKEEIDQSRLDKSYLTKDGKYTWGHKPPNSPHDPENILGVIDLAETRKAGLYTEGELAKGKRKAVIIYNDMKNNPDLSLYKASIEGKYKLYRNPAGQIRKSAIVYNVAYDTNVVNTQTLCGVLKSLDSGISNCQCEKSLDLCETEKDRLSLFIYHEAICNHKPMKKIEKMAKHYFKAKKH